ncbi:hypothetical protein KR52_01020 [Synechococcus sp. KORDI-52]|nr:hypothetical protein KR52_01020 [Synechococcus sp. KORDI-52]
MGNALVGQGNLDGAIDAYNTALGLKNDFPKAHNNLGVVLQREGRLDNAVASYRNAIKHNPDFPEAHNNLGNALKDLGKLSTAIDSYKTAIELKPNYAEAHTNLGTTLQEQGNLTAAIDFYKTAIALKPNYAEAHNNLGTALQQQGNLTAAIASYNKALKLKKDNPEVHWNSSLTMLLGGDYKNGWEKYEWRTKTGKVQLKPHASPRSKLWNGKFPKKEVKLLIVTEQGLGDTLQFMRYALVLKKYKFNISLCAPARLHPLIKSSGIDSSPLTPEQANQVSEGEWIQLLSVPRYLNISPANPIITGAYIKPTDKLSCKWKKILSTNQMPNIGINWRGNRDDTNKQGRNIPIHSFRKIVDSYTGNFLCLQRGSQPLEIEQLQKNRKITPHQLDILRIADSEHPEDFLEYAAIINNCDLVITTGSTAAHMAAGMGIPTWVLLPKVPDWRWGLYGDSTFWYPSMRLFRQNENGDWNEVMQRVKLALQEHFGGGLSTRI